VDDLSIKSRNTVPITFLLLIASIHMMKNYV